MEERTSIKESIIAIRELTQAPYFNKVRTDDGTTITERDFTIKDLQEMVENEMYQLCDLLGFSYDEVE